MDYLSLHHYTTSTVLYPPKSALGEYIPGVGKGNAKDFDSLPGLGGVYNYVNSNLYHYAGNNPVKYIDPTGNFDLLCISPREFFSFLVKHDSGAKTAKLYIDAASGDKVAQAMAKDVTIAAGKEMAKNVTEAGKTAAVVTLDAVEATADIVSEVSGDIALVGFATAQPEIAGPFGTLSDGASAVSLGASGAKAAITGEERDSNDFVSKGRKFAVSKTFTLSLSKTLQVGSNGSISKFNADATAAFTDKVLTKSENEN